MLNEIECVNLKKLTINSDQIFDNENNSKQELYAHWAAYHGADEIILALNKRNVDLDTRDSSGETPLSKAITMGNFSTARLILRSQNINVNNIDNYRNSYLHLIAMNYKLTQSEKLILTSELLNRNIEIKFSKKGIIPLYLLMIPNHDYQNNHNMALLIVSSMIKKSLIEITDIRAILFESINNRFYDMLELMGKNSLIDENLRFFNNDSLFHIAARENDVIAIKILFKYIPLCINEPNNLFCSPLHSAINSRSLEVIKELINQRANMYLVDDKGCDALFLAIKSGSIVIFNHIISAGYKIDVNLTDYRGNNLLMMAVGTTSAYIQKNRISKDSLESRVSIIKKLLEFNFDFNHKNHKNKNVLDVSHDLITKTVIQPFNNVKNNTSNKPSI